MISARFASLLADEYLAGVLGRAFEGWGFGLQSAKQKRVPPGFGNDRRTPTTDAKSITFEPGGDPAGMTTAGVTVKRTIYVPPGLAFFRPSWQGGAFQCHVLARALPR